MEELILDLQLQQLLHRGALVQTAGNQSMQLYLATTSAETLLKSAAVVSEVLLLEMLVCLFNLQDAMR